jgi:hypothetical protein
MGGFSSIWEPIDTFDRYREDVQKEYALLNEAKRKAEVVRKAYVAKKNELESTALINKFLIGCDPEFVGVDGMNFIPMNNYFGERGPIGFDHGGSVGEFRPKPAKYAWTLIQRLKESVDILKKKGIGGKIRAGAMVNVARGSRSYVTLGGHVHIDIDPYDGVGGGEEHVHNGTSVSYENYFENQNSIFRGYSVAWDLTSPRPANSFNPHSNVILTWVGRTVPVISKAHTQRVVALDEFTKLLEHLDILPAKECQARRTTSEYGKYGDVRIQASTETIHSADYGDYSEYEAARRKAARRHRMEYRTMASWLYDPIVAFLCLTGAKVAAAYPEVALENLKGQTSFRAIPAWLERYGSKDMDCARLTERYLVKGHRALVVDPETDIRERWDTGKG